MLPVQQADFKKVWRGISITKFLADENIVSSRSEAIRLIKNNGLALNNKKNKIKDVNYKLTIDDLHPSGERAKIIFWLSKSSYCVVFFFFVPVEFKTLKGKRFHKKAKSFIKSCVKI